MNLTKELENIANLTIIILAIVLVGLLARNYSLVLRKLAR